MLNKFRDFGCYMSIKVYYLHSYLVCSPQNLGDTCSPGTKDNERPMHIKYSYNS